MSRPIWLALMLAASLCGCAGSTPEQQVVYDAVTALGGEPITRAKTLVIEGTGTQGNLGQDMTPDAASQTFRVTEYTRAIDWSTRSPRVRVGQTRTPTFVYFQGPQPQKQVLGLDGDVAYNVSPSGAVTRASETAARDRRGDLYHHPVTALRAALDSDATLTNVRTEGQERLVDVTTVDGAAFTLAVDATTKRPTRVISRSAHPNLGDVTIDTRFDNYQKVGSMQLPGRLTTRVDDFTTSDIMVTRQAVDAETGDLAAPASASAAPPAAPPAPQVAAEAVVPGVWLLGGQSHHSALIEFSDHLMIIEAPQSEARTLAVIAAARELRPAKPVAQMVNSHHHFDHSAGIRAAVSEGLTIITHAGNAAFMQDIVKRPHTIAPDALAKKPGALTLETVEASRTYADPSMSVVLFAVDGNPHSETMLMAWVPKHRLLIQADAFSPGAPIQPYAPNLVANVRMHGLAVDRVVPLHGTVAPYSDLEKLAAPAATR